MHLTPVGAQHTRVHQHTYFTLYTASVCGPHKRPKNESHILPIQAHTHPASRCNLLQVQHLQPGHASTQRRWPAFCPRLPVQKAHVMAAVSCAASQRGMHTNSSKANYNRTQHDGITSPLPCQMPPETLHSLHGHGPVGDALPNEATHNACQAVLQELHTQAGQALADAVGANTCRQQHRTWGWVLCALTDVHMPHS